MEDDKNIRNVAVLAGNIEQFRNYLHEKGICVGFGSIVKFGDIRYVYATDCSHSLGMRFDEIVEVGTFYERLDYDMLLGHIKNQMR
jgi:hypothetical protein